MINVLVTITTLGRESRPGSSRFDTGVSPSVNWELYHTVSVTSRAEIRVGLPRVGKEWHASTCSLSAGTHAAVFAAADIQEVDKWCVSNSILLDMLLRTMGYYTWKNISAHFCCSTLLARTNFMFVTRKALDNFVNILTSTGCCAGSWIDILWSLVWQWDIIVGHWQWRSHP
jgi:hypothetical protein